MVRYGKACSRLLLSAAAASALLLVHAEATEQVAHNHNDNAGKVAGEADSTISPSDAQHWSAFSSALDSAADTDLIDAIARGGGESLGLVEADPMALWTKSGTNYAENEHDDMQRNAKVVEEANSERELYTPKYADGGGGTRGGSYYRPAPAPTPVPPTAAAEVEEETIAADNRVSSTATQEDDNDETTESATNAAATNRGYPSYPSLPENPTNPWTYNPHPKMSPKVQCPYGGALQVPRVDGEVCIRPGQGICADGWTFFIDKYHDGQTYLMLWKDDDRYPVVKWFPGAEELCIGERYRNIAYLYVEYGDGTCYLVGPNAGNPCKLPRLKIVPGSSDYNRRDAIVKFRDGAGDDDTLLSIMANGNAETADDAKWMCVINSAAPSISPMPSSTPSASPSDAPSASPSVAPTGAPSASPSDAPTGVPSASPSASPTISMMPSDLPSISPSSIPSASPSLNPSAKPSVSPSNAPTTECNRDNVGSFAELVSRINAANEATDGPTRTSIVVCPGNYTFTQDIVFDRKLFDLACDQPRLCNFDLNGYSFLSELAILPFSVSFTGFNMENGNGDGRNPFSQVFDDTFGRTGGAIQTFAGRDQSRLEVVNCRFYRNEALGGGAVAAFGNIDVVVDQTDFLQNAAITNPTSTSELQGLGGAILADDGIASIGGPDAQITLTITNSQFVDNVALVTGGGIEFSPPRPLTITRTFFQYNKALNDGGALASYGGILNMDDVFFWGNSAGYAGGAMAWGPNATGIMTRSQFDGNFNAIIGRPPSPDIYRLGDGSGNLATVSCGGTGNQFCDASGFPATVSTNFNDVTCAGSRTDGMGCIINRVDLPEGGPQLPPVGINRAELEPTIAWSWPRTRISV